MNLNTLIYVLTQARDQLAIDDAALIGIKHGSYSLAKIAAAKVVYGTDGTVARIELVTGDDL